ncbi:conserved hypothetical protein [Streptomyces misionensis JCM 4497]
MIAVLCVLRFPHADAHSATEQDPTDTPGQARPRRGRRRHGRHRRGGAAADDGRRPCGGPAGRTGHPGGLARQSGLRRDRQGARTAARQHPQVARQGGTEAAQGRGGQPGGLPLPGVLSAARGSDPRVPAAVHGGHRPPEVRRGTGRGRGTAQLGQRLPGGHHRQHRPGRGRREGGHGQGRPGHPQPAGARHAPATGRHPHLRPRPRHPADHRGGHPGRKPLQHVPAHGPAADAHRQPRRGRDARRDQPDARGMAVLRDGQARGHPLHRRLRDPYAQCGRVQLPAPQRRTAVPIHRTVRRGRLNRGTPWRAGSLVVRHAATGLPSANSRLMSRTAARPARLAPMVLAEGP